MNELEELQSVAYALGITFTADEHVTERVTLWFRRPRDAEKFDQMTCWLDGAETRWSEEREWDWDRMPWPERALAFLGKFQDTVSLPVTDIPRALDSLKYELDYRRGAISGS